MKHSNAAASGQIVSLHSLEWLEKQRIAGKTAALVLTYLNDLVRTGTTLTLRQMSEAAEKIIRDMGCEPTFKGYCGHGNIPFPEAVCISVNRQLVHGVPTDAVLRDGDIVSFDLGATYQGVVADTAITTCYGDYLSSSHLNLVQGTYEALVAAIKSIKVGNHLGCIGNAIAKKAKQYNLGLITQYGGHGIDTDQNGKPIPHAAPFVPNKAEPNEGIIIQEGLALAIEPLCCIGNPKTRVSSDKWTVETEGVSAHWEHSIFVHKDTVEVVTLRESEKI